MKSGICPKCGSSKVTRILYGLPAMNKKLEEDLEEGRIVLGGCVIGEDSPAWACVACEHRWGED